MGDHFGETIMKKDMTRTANAAAVTRVKCLTLRRNDFIFIFGANNEIMSKVGNLIESRQKESVKALRK
jgi:CRP-like cAMP-binding protein